MNKALISWEDFDKIDMRTGTVISVDIFEKAKKPAYKIVVDFGEAGIKKTSAQITTVYNTTELVGRQIIGVINFPPKQIVDFRSEFLLLGVINSGDVIVLQPERATPNGLQVG